MRRITSGTTDELKGQDDTNTEDVVEELEAWREKLQKIYEKLLNAAFPNAPPKGFHFRAIPHDEEEDEPE